MSSPVIPCRKYQDPKSAMRWLSDALGFEPHFVAEAPNGRVEHAQMTLGAGMLMLGQADEPQPPSVVYIAVADIDAAYARAQAAGAEITRPLQDTEYGSREFSVRDPEGGDWGVGSYDPWAPTV